MLDNELKLNRRHDLNERTLEGETLILDRTNGQIHHLNSTATYVWRYCEGLSTSEIAKRLVETFQIDPASAERDARALLEEMKIMNLLGNCSND